MQQRSRLQGIVEAHVWRLKQMFPPFLLEEKLFLPWRDFVKNYCNFQFGRDDVGRGAAPLLFPPDLRLPRSSISLQSLEFLLFRSFFRNFGQHLCEQPEVAHHLVLSTEPRVVFGRRTDIASWSGSPKCCPSKGQVGVLADALRWPPSVLLQGLPRT